MALRPRVAPGLPLSEVTVPAAEAPERHHVKRRERLVQSRKLRGIESRLPKTNHAKFASRFPRSQGDLRRMEGKC